METRNSRCGSKKQNCANQCIACTVTQCKYHCEDQNYCTREHIEVISHEQNPTVPQCTDCSSFELRG